MDAERFPEHLVAGDTLGKNSGKFSVDPRFFNEARAVNIVSHPGVVGSFDYGEMPDGTAYIVMEYLEGESLSARIKRTAGPFGFDALRIGRQIGAALAAAHSKGIIHRDAYEKTMTCFRVSAKDAHRRRKSHGYSEAQDGSYSPLQLV